MKYVIAVRSTNDRSGFKGLEYSEFYIEARNFDNNGVKNPAYVEKYHIANDGQLDYSFTEDFKFINVSMPDIYDTSEKLNYNLMSAENQVQYSVFESAKDMGAHSPCAIKHQYKRLDGEAVIYFKNFLLINIEDAIEEMEDEDNFIYVQILAEIPGDRDSLALPVLKILIPDDGPRIPLKCKFCLTK
jgi:hypothetical protein